MSVTPEIFADGMALIAEHARVEFSPSLSGIWFEAVDAELDDDTFIAGVKRMIRVKPFAPTIQEVIDAGLGAAMSATAPAGGLAFTALVETPSRWDPRTGSTWERDEITARLGAPALIAFLAIGGQARIRRLHDNADNADLPFARKEYVAAYQDAIDAERARGQLAAMLPDGHPLLRSLGMRDAGARTAAIGAPEPLSRLIAAPATVGAAP